MKITLLSDGINKTYVQSLCMAFFHGIKFPQNEEENDDGLELTVSAETVNGQICCSVTLKLQEKIFQKDHLYIPGEYESEQRAMKTAVGQALYKACNQATQRDIEWGILTGIRPSKVCAELLSNHSENEAYGILVEKYFLSTTKAKLVIDVAKNENLIMSKTNDETCSIYISIPFCPSRCTYCSFISYAGKKLFDLIPSYVERLLADIKKIFALTKEVGLTISCVYIGGGTPTILNESQLEAVLGAIHSSVNVDTLDEFTLEGGRPDTITEAKLQIAKKYGITRISVNPQTLNDTVLEKIGRKHSANDFFKAYDIVSKSGIKVINTDLIAGLDGDSFDTFKATVDKIIELSPENVTVHTFCVKKSAQILKDDEEIYEKEGAIAQNSVNYAYEKLVSNGYSPYYMYRQKNTVGNLENLGYSKDGYFGLYNVFMMSDAHTVFGIGAGATTKLVKHCGEKCQISRIFSHKYPYEYLRDEQNIEEQVKEFFNRR